jgi:hypothetical protein
MGSDGVVGLAVEATHREAGDEVDATQFQRRKVGGEQHDALAGGEGLLEVFGADDLVRGKLVDGFPPAGGGFEQAKGQGLEVREGELVDFSGTFLREAEAEVDQHDMPAQAHDVEDEPGERAGQPAAFVPGEPAGTKPEEGEPGPHRPVRRDPEIGLLAGAAHALEA